MQEIARGGMGVVYKARQIRLNRIVALKMILSGQFASSADVKRFYGEAEAAAGLDHPGIVQIFDIGNHQGMHYFSMAYIEGRSLASALRDGPLPPKEATRLMIRISEAVAHAHSKGVIHRDLKPANIMLDKQHEPRVTDFGLAKRFDHASELTQSGTIMGTPSYMPPEQARGDVNSIGPTSDVYSLGAILYCLLTGRPPFQAASLAETLQQVMESDPLPARLLNHNVPRDLDTICSKCLHKSQSRRYAGASQLHDDLVRFQRGESILARPESKLRHCIRWCLRHPALASCIIVSIIAIGLLVWGAESSRQISSAMMRLKTSQELADKNLQYANLQRYHVQVSEARELASRQELGWSWRAIDKISAASELRPPEITSDQLRQLAAEALTSTDAREVDVIVKDFDVNALAFSPNGKFLALGQNRGTPSSKLIIYDVDSKKIHHKFELPTWSNFLRAFERAGKNFQESFCDLAWSPNGDLIAAGLKQGNVCVWDLRKPDQKPKVLEVSKSQILNVQFATDGTQIYTASDDNEFAAWDLISGVRRFCTGTYAGKFAVSPNGDLILLKHDALKLVRTSDFVELACPLPERLESFCFSTDGRFVRGLCDDRIMEIDIANQRHRVVATVPENYDFATGNLFAWYVEGDFVVVYSKNTGMYCILRASTGELLARLSGFGRSSPCASLATDGHTLAIAADNDTRLFDIRSQEVQTIATQSALPLQCGTIDRKGQHIVWLGILDDNSSAKECEFGNFDLNTGILKREAVYGIQSPSYFSSRLDSSWPVQHGVCVSDDNQIAVCCPQIGTVWFQGSKWRWPKQWQENGGTVQCIFAEQLILGDDRQAELIGDEHTESGKARRLIKPSDAFELSLPRHDPTGDQPLCAAFARIRAESPNDTSLVLQVKTQWNEQLVEIPMKNGSYGWYYLGAIASAAIKDKDISFRIGLADSSSSAGLVVDQVCIIPCGRTKLGDRMLMPTNGTLSFSPSQDMVYGLSDATNMCCWNAATGELTSSVSNMIQRTTRGPCSLTYLSASKNLVAASSVSGDILLINARDGKIKTYLPGPGGPVDCCCISPNENWIAIGTRAGEIRVYDWDNESTRYLDLKGPIASIRGLAFDLSRNLLVAGSEDGSIRIWRRNGPAWNEYLTLARNGSSITSLSIDQYGRTLLATKKNDHSLHTWNLEALWSRIDSLVSKEQ